MFTLEMVYLRNGLLTFLNLNHQEKKAPTRTYTWAFTKTEAKRSHTRL